MPDAATRKTNTEMMVMVTSTVMTTDRVSRPEKECNRFFIDEQMDQPLQTYEKSSRLVLPMHLGRGDIELFSETTGSFATFSR